MRVQAPIQFQKRSLAGWSGIERSDRKRNFGRDPNHDVAERGIDIWKIGN